MESLDTFTQLPLTLDPTTKAISTTSSTNNPPLASELTTLNALHRALLSLDSSHPVPPPPVPVNPKRSAAIGKLRDSGNTAYKKSQYPDALKFYSLAIDMALQRPPWEPAGLVREELAGLYSNRAQTHMASQSWVEGAVDAECSVEIKKMGNGKAWFRRGVCLKEMGRLNEAKAWVVEALEFEQHAQVPPPQQQVQAQSVEELFKLRDELDDLIGRKGG
ncbi:hypothetical protein LTR66_003626 [Elasticomyces elasticus]|nr:hypothetical protein LTR66_003626 [Elasticomyces elasticus]